MSDRLTRRLIGTVALALGLVAAGAGVASAHITVSAPGATRGGSDAEVSVRVPDESDSAKTIGLKLRLPSDTPIASVLVQPKAGWTATVSQTKLSTPIKTDDGPISEVVSEIDWKVSSGGQGIGPGQFDEFVFLAGQLPDTAALTFKAIQTYSDGTTVSWIEVPAQGSSAEPEHPAPVLTLGAGSGSEPVSGSSGSSPSSSATAGAVTDSHSGHAEATTTEPASKSTAVTGVFLGGLGVLLGLAALVVALRRRRA
jgi:periplasmic copper chaperone A